MVRDVAWIARRLRAGGADVGPDRVATAVEALAALSPTPPERMYWVLRCTLISRRDDVELFDSLFEAPDGSSSVADGESQLLVECSDTVGAENDESPADEDAGQGVRWSAQERLRELDFAAYSDAEQRELRRLTHALGFSLPRRRSRRLRAARDGATLDVRRTLRGAMRTDGYALERCWSRASVAPRKLVFVVDISASMAAYARAMLIFVQAAVRANRRVEAFAFGTRLTRITNELRARDPERALAAASLAVPDWAGGTRIGENLKLLNDSWGKRGVTRGAVVVVLSDGWERGDTDLLATEMARLQRCAHALVWVNPLLADPDYEPLVAGMASSLPYVDHFVPGHNLRSLEELGNLLSNIPAERTRAKARS